MYVKHHLLSTAWGAPDRLTLHHLETLIEEAIDQGASASARVEVVNGHIRVIWSD